MNWTECQGKKEEGKKTRFYEASLVGGGGGGGEQQPSSSGINNSSKVNLGTLYALRTYARREVCLSVGHLHAKCKMEESADQQQSIISQRNLQLPCRQCTLGKKKKKKAIYVLGPILLHACHVLAVAQPVELVLFHLLGIRAKLYTESIIRQARA